MRIELDEEIDLRKIIYEVLNELTHKERAIIEIRFNIPLTRAEDK